MTLISPGFVDSNIRRVDNEGNLHAGARGSELMPAAAPRLSYSATTSFPPQDPFQELGTNSQESRHASKCLLSR